MNDLVAHPLGEEEKRALVPVSEPIAVETFRGRIYVEWNPEVAVTPLGYLPFFIEYLQVSGLYEAWVSRCPLEWNG